jgi:hypothetical protein
MLRRVRDRRQTAALSLNHRVASLCGIRSRILCLVVHMSGCVLSVMSVSCRYVGLCLVGHVCVLSVMSGCDERRKSSTDSHPSAPSGSRRPGHARGCTSLPATRESVKFLRPRAIRTVLGIPGCATRHQALNLPAAPGLLPVLLRKTRLYGAGLAVAGQA